MCSQNQVTTRFAAWHDNHDNVYIPEAAKLQLNLRYLCRDDSLVPILGQVDLRNQAVVSGNVSHVNEREGTESIGKDAGTEQEEDNLLETSPLAQKSCGVIIVLHGVRTLNRDLGSRYSIDC